MEEPIRIAQIIGKLNAAGVEAVINNYYRNIDHTKFQFDYYIEEDSNCTPPQELVDMGARYYVIPPYQRPFQYMSGLIKKFKENQYQIVHVNMNTLSVFALCAAWIAKVPVRINHNHSTAGKGETKRNILKYALRPFAKIFATHYCACSVYAGEWLFGKNPMKKGKVQVFNNAIDVGKFAFNPDVRQEVRKELHIEDKTVIGHVGRFCYQKNHEFLIDIFNQVYQRDNNAVLVLVGIGELTDTIKDKVHRLGLEGKVMFLGERKDVHRIYQGMDVFVLPSRYEGLPVVGVEAQAAGLPCVMSDQVSEEVRMLDSTVFISPEVPVDNWASAICRVAENFPRREGTLELQKTGFDIDVEAKKLERFYTKLMEQIERHAKENIHMEAAVSQEKKAFEIQKTEVLERADYLKTQNSNLKVEDDTRDMKLCEGKVDLVSDYNVNLKSKVGIDDHAEMVFGQSDNFLEADSCGERNDSYGNRE